MEYQVVRNFMVKTLASKNDEKNLNLPHHKIFGDLILTVFQQRRKRRDLLQLR